MSKYYYNCTVNYGCWLRWKPLCLSYHNIMVIEPVNSRIRNKQRWINQKKRRKLFLLPRTLWSFKHESNYGFFLVLVWFSSFPWIFFGFLICKRIYKIVCEDHSILSNQQMIMAMNFGYKICIFIIVIPMQLINVCGCPFYHIMKEILTHTGHHLFNSFSTLFID